MTNIIIIIVTLGILVFVHELGHLMTAKFFKIGVKVFSLGFGSKITSKTFGGTEYRLSLIPLGGFVSFKDDKSPNVQGYTFEETSVLVRSLVVLAGPLSNILLAFAFFWIVFGYNGLNIIMPTVGSVLPSSPAERSDIQVGDTILKIAGIEIEYWEDVVNEIGATEGEPFEMTVLRNGIETNINVEPEKRIQKNIYGQEKTIGYLGINPKDSWQVLELGFIESAKQSLFFTWQVSIETIDAFYMLFTGHLPSDAIGGPIMISQTISDHAQKGLATLMLLVAVISVNLALVNLIPLPVLDGGHILMFMIEAVRGRPISEKIQLNFQRIGLAIILLLLILGTYNDIMRL